MFRGNGTIAIQQKEVKQNHRQTATSKKDKSLNLNNLPFNGQHTVWRSNEKAALIHKCTSIFFGNLWIEQANSKVFSAPLKALLCGPRAPAVILHIHWGPT